MFWQQTLFPGPYDLEPITVVRNRSIADVDMSNWQTYQNEKYGFGMSIPRDWEATIMDGHLCFGEKGKQYIINLGIMCGIDITVYSPSANCENCITASELIQRRNKPEEVTSINGEKATIQTDGPDMQTLVDHAGRTYRIHTFFPAEVRDIYFSILSTFKFIK